MQISEQEDKMIKLRTQVQQNQSELQSYLADLDKWEKDIRQKEEHLTAVKTSGKNQDLPPVRNTIEKKKMKKIKKKKENVDASKPKKISGYDFRAWDKFDVDKALEEIDNKKVETSSSEYETDEEWEIERKKHLAAAEKDKGNEFLKKGDYVKAVEAYTKGMSFDSTNAVLPANRSLALLKQEKFGAAELDCTVSISLDPLYVKAYLRRATARVSLGKLDEAIADYNHVLNLEPSNKQAKAEVERLKLELKREKEDPVVSTLTEEEKGVVKPIYKQPEERSKAPLKRIIIEEIGIDPNIGKQPANMEHSETVKKITAREEENFDKLINLHSTPQQPRPTSPNVSQSPLSFVTESSRLEPTNLASQANENHQQEIVSNSSNVIEIEHNQNSVIKSTIPTNVLKAQKRPSWNAASNIDNNSGHSTNSDLSQQNTVSSNTNSDSSEFSVPLTSFQFQTDFRLLKNQPEKFFKYFQAISPDQYPKLFGQCLDADMLTQILKSLAANSDRCVHDVYEVLNQLSQVKRFSMTAMFLSANDKQVAKGLMEQLSKSGARPQNDILSLSRKYEL